ncbi:hypothetical protein [Rhodanobacter sp. B04]|uniref:hypothetical protein n=1 Tax=Rhodanobacter sp. B04 TaxID=1945860 RepID=UPI001439DF4A|nr:hypothetical protein [Rhodanobacter sp. B04]
MGHRIDTRSRFRKTAGTHDWANQPPLQTVEDRTGTSPPEPDPPSRPAAFAENVARVTLGASQIAAQPSSQPYNREDTPP